ncbi:MAG: GNAT family N-acetyltransferase [Bdellovibrionales bacterium]|nr:GNAT family N-acetyltransferase [Bdellovibrionales bacterium]
MQAELTEVFLDSKTYFQNVDGVQVDGAFAHQAAMDTLEALPPGCDRRQKQCLLIPDENGRPMAVVDLIQHYPRRGIAFLGLLLIRESAQKKGRGRALSAWVEAFAKEKLGCHTIRLSVVDSNPVQGFWEKLGYQATGEAKPHEGEKIKSQKRLMEKRIPWPALDETLQYLNSDLAQKDLLTDPYWPKWDGPWWRMLLLHEMGFSELIPKPVVRTMVERLNNHYLRIFPIHSGDLPAGTDPVLGTLCHCAVGNIFQVLHSCGVDVDSEIPWLRPWFFKYQMPDGGLNCDNDAYLKPDLPSSMVGTIACLEAVLKCTPRAYTEEEILFLDRGAKFLIDRKISLGSSSPNNAEEKEDEQDWKKIGFPRFYFYDILRGFRFLEDWSKKMGRPLPTEAFLEDAGRMDRRLRRRSYEGNRTRVHENGEWVRKDARLFPLLEEVSAVGISSPYL